MIYLFGDSHTSNFLFLGDKCKRCHLGAILAYSFGKNWERCDIRKFGVQEDDTCIFSFGEIDCRCHINKHALVDYESYQDVIDHVVNIYTHSIFMNVSTYNNLNVYVYSIPPAPQLHNTWSDKGYPFVGDDEERKNYVMYFNKKLKEKCDELGYGFIDVYHHYVDENGYLDKKYSDDHVHIADICFVKEIWESLNRSIH